MTDYQREIVGKLSAMRDLAKATNSTQATEALTKLATSYNKFIIEDMLKQYGVLVPLNTTKPLLVNALVRKIVTEAVIDKSWQRCLFRTLAVIS